MRVEAVVLYRDKGMTQVFGNLGERHIAPVLVHAKPALAIGGEEPGVANAARQLVNGVALTQQPGDAERRHDHEDAEDDRGDPIAQRARRRHERNRTARRTCSMAESTT